MNILRRLQLVAHGEPSDVIELSSVSRRDQGKLITGETLLIAGGLR
jgi:hypothetical protein